MIISSKICKRLGVVAVALFALSVEAGYRRGELIWGCDFTKDDAARVGAEGAGFDANGDGIAWQSDGGEQGDGALAFRGRTVKRSIVPDRPMTGLVFIEARVRGEDVRKGPHDFNGPKVMFPYRPKEGANVRYPQLPGEFGTFGWTSWVRVERIPETAVGFRFVLGLEESGGLFVIDSVRVYRAEETDDANEVAPPNPAADRIPRGPWGAKGNPSARRGVMSGCDMSEASVRNLQDWGVNLVRLQVGGLRGCSLATMDDYLTALDGKLEELAPVMDRCAAHGIKVVLDLHSPPACKATKYASNVVPDDYDPSTLCEAWRRIVRKFGKHPATYAYDIINEPLASPEKWNSVFLAAMHAIRELDKNTPCITESVAFYYEGENVIYSPHYYSPHALTHCGVRGNNEVRWSYPGYINGQYWNRDRIRLALEPFIRFQLEHPGVKMLVGEFSCILWSKGADAYIRDCIAIFEEYGWDWCYHAYREWPPWDVEYTHDENYTVGECIRPKQDTPRKKALLEGLSHNSKVL